MVPAALPAPTPGALLTASDVARVVDRMAHQLIEKAGNGLADLVLVGIPTRGAPLARRLAARVEAFSGTPIAVGTVVLPLMILLALSKVREQSRLRERSE